MVILFYAQLNHSLFEAARLETGGIRRRWYIYVLHHMGWVSATERCLISDIWPRDTTASMDRLQRAAAVGTSLHPRGGGGSILVCCAKPKICSRNYPIRSKVDMDHLCIVGGNAKPSELTKNHPIKIEIDMVQRVLFQPLRAHAISVLRSPFARPVLKKVYPPWPTPVFHPL